MGATAAGAISSEALADGVPGPIVSDAVGRGAAACGVQIAAAGPPLPPPPQPATNCIYTKMMAEGTLTGAQLQDIQTQVQQALAGVSPTLTGLARLDAITNALESVAQTDACAMGPDAVSAITADAIIDGALATRAVDAVIRGAVGCGMQGSLAIARAIIGAVGAGASAANVAAQALATANAIPIPADQVGAGMGIAAAYCSGCDVAAATEIGQTVANEGTQPTRLAFRDAVIQNGGSTQIAELSDAFPVATGETGETGLGNNNNFGNNTNQGNGSGDEGTSNNLQANLNQNLNACGRPTCG